MSLLPVYHARSLRQGGRSYFVDEQGVRLPSVTTILNATKPAADWQRLQQWRDRVGAETANQITRRASHRGTLTHKHLRRYLLGNPVDLPATVQPYWQSLEPVLAEVGDVRLVEGGVFHYGLGYAGKVDCIASYRGTPCILDWKTADQPRGSIERLYDGPLQLAAYCGAANMVYAEAGIDLRHAALVVAIPEQTAEVFWLEPAAIAQYWQQWRERVALFYSNQRSR